MAMPSLQELKTIRIDHTGALRAPKRLRDAAAKNKRGELPDDELAALRESVIEEIIRKQEAVGLPTKAQGVSGQFQRRRGRFRPGTPQPALAQKRHFQALCSHRAGWHKEMARIE